MQPTISHEVQHAFDATRDFSRQAFRSVCYAPWTSLYFYPTGEVRACCVNEKYPLGDLRQQTLDEIWHGPRVAAMRQALRAYNLKLGCEFCQWQLEDRSYGASQTRKFDEFTVPAGEEFWPSNMEFTLSNTCNLECVMCKGELSSLIRSRREKLPPLPKAYGDQFFADLRKYIPHLKAAQFQGGEPFLEQESYRVWEMMIEDRLRGNFHITTNGTTWNPKVERVLDNLRVSISVSIDGITKPTLEAIRLNADFDTVMENFRRFHAYCRRQGTSIGFSFCLMRQNWHEFADFLRFAEQWGCPTFVCGLSHPPEYSLFSLPPAELKHVVDTLDQQSIALTPTLKVNTFAWSNALDRLRNRLQNYAASVDFLHDTVPDEQRRQASLLPILSQQ